MRVRDMHVHMCAVCWACLILCCVPVVGMLVVTVLLLFAGAWVGVAWVGGTSVVFGGLIFMVAYLEARTHWKKTRKGTTCS